jgi:hypothetical protein
VRVKIPRDHLLPIEFIAKLWAADLQGTPLEEDENYLLGLLVSAVWNSQLSPTDEEGSDPLKEWGEAYRTVSTDRERALTLELARGEIPEMKVSRDEFLGYATWKGYPPPKFWDDERIVEPAAKHILAPTAEPVIKKPPRAVDWARREVAAGRIPGTAGYTYKMAVAQALKDHPKMRGLSERNVKRIFRDA